MNAKEPSKMEKSTLNTENVTAGTDTSSNKRILQGKVVSSKADKTIVIKVVRQIAHPLYKKYFKRSKKFMAHDEQNSCNIGDTVKVRECRPLSAMKRWELIEIIERAK
jgi:small subunit ribosomal protein S17